MDTSNDTIPTSEDTDFQIAQSPSSQRDATADTGIDSEIGNLLPRSYGVPAVFAIARNPRSLFVYWDIDWSAAFAKIPPVERKVYLRVQDSNGDEISSTAVEPMAGSCDLPVEKIKAGHRVDLGYFDADQDWRSVGTSNVVSAAPDKFKDEGPAVFATVPFHLSFQRMTDLLRDAGEEGSVIDVLGRLQKKALAAEEGNAITPAEEEVLRVLEAGLPETWRDREVGDVNEIEIEKRLEEILGFGSSSPTGAFGGSSSRSV